jgi:biopolymer transport protein ExbB/TolQ
MLDTVISFFQSGGPFMYPILLVLAIGLTITIERYVYLSAIKSKNRRALAQIMPMLQKGELNSVIKYTKDSSAAVSKILAQGLLNFKSARRRDDIEASMEESIMEENNWLLKRLRRP